MTEANYFQLIWAGLMLGLFFILAWMARGYRVRSSINEAKPQAANERNISSWHIFKTVSTFITIVIGLVCAIIKLYTLLR